MLPASDWSPVRTYVNTRMVRAGGGHAKLGDFGAVRPITDTARDFCESARHAIRDLRDGDWRVKVGIQQGIQHGIQYGIQQGIQGGDATCATATGRSRWVALHFQAFVIQHDNRRATTVSALRRRRLANFETCAELLGPATREEMWRKALALSTRGGYTTG